VSGPVHVSDDGRVVQAPVRSGSGLATAIVRHLDAAGAVVDDIAVHHPSLDDVFLALTGAPHVDDQRPDGEPVAEHEGARA